MIGFLLFAGSAAPIPDMEKKVQIDGSTYRVVVKAGIATVRNKAFAYKPNMEERDRQRLAAKQATGCDAVDELDFGGYGYLKAKLACPSKATNR